MTFESFDNLEDMLRTIQERAEEAMRNLRPIQRTIQAGDYVVCPIDRLKVLVYGQTYDDDHILMSEMSAGASQDEATYTLEHLKDARRRGYYYGHWYSTIVPDGEYGDQHVSQCWPITKEEFELAAANDWVMPTDALIAMLARFFADEEGGES